jgi:hypothetical protein
MAGIWKKLTSIFGRSSDAAPDARDGEESADEAFWNEVYRARQAFFESRFGPLPDDILKLGHLFGVWPGGGLFVVPARRLSANLWIHTTFGLSNADMPTGVTASDVEVERDEKGRVGKTSTTLRSKTPAQTSDGAAGYGYEIMVVTRDKCEWPLWFLQWAVNAELLHDAGILDRVEQYDGLTIEEIRVGEDEEVNVLIAKAVDPLPSGTTLPNGKLQLLIATTITAEEMNWSMENGRGALLEKLKHEGIGQVSVRDRPSVPGV